MNFAIIQNGTVANVIVADQGFINVHCPGAVRIDTLTPVPGIGWTYDGTVFTAPPAPPLPPGFGA